MIVVAFQNGAVVMRSGKVGLGLACCCGCCSSYENCHVSYRVTLSDASTIDGSGYLNISGDANIEEAAGGAFAAVAYNSGPQCYLSISWFTEAMCPDTFDVVAYGVRLFYRISCAECCGSAAAGASNCTLTLLESGVTIEPPCGSGTPVPGEPYVTGIELLSFECSPADCCDGGHFLMDVADCMCSEGAPPPGVTIDPPAGTLLDPGAVWGDYAWTTKSRCCQERIASGLPPCGNPLP